MSDIREEYVPVYPGDTRPPGYRRARARTRYAKLKRLGEDEVPARAALGRMLYYGGDGYNRAVPQRGSTSIEAIAWERESGRNRGYLNRRMRKFQETAADVHEIYFDDIEEDAA